MPRATRSSAAVPRSIGLPAAMAPGARVLVLGSMPGAESLRLQQYYAHPQNAFWRLVEDLFGIPRTLDYATRMAALNRAGVAVWDVLADCLRPGSLDASIDVASARPNDIAALLQQYPSIEGVVLNGGFAEKTFRRRIAIDAVKAAALRVVAVPSTSPANAAIPYPVKLERWREALQPMLDAVLR